MNMTFYAINLFEIVSRDAISNCGHTEFFVNIKFSQRYIHKLSCNMCKYLNSGNVNGMTNQHHHHHPPPTHQTDIWHRNLIKFHAEKKMRDWMKRMKSHKCDICRGCPVCESICVIRD